MYENVESMVTRKVRLIDTFPIIFLKLIGVALSRSFNIVACSVTTVLGSYGETMFIGSTKLAFL